MEELFLLQILTNIWELHLAAMLNGIYMLKKKSSTISLTIYPALSNRDQSQLLSVIHHGFNS
jgi:hypothetical protein